MHNYSKSGHLFICVFFYEAFVVECNLAASCCDRIRASVMSRLELRLARFMYEINYKVLWSANTAFTTRIELPLCCKIVIIYIKTVLQRWLHQELCIPVKKLKCYKCVGEVRNEFGPHLTAEKKEFQTRLVKKMHFTLHAFCCFNI